MQAIRRRRVTSNARNKGGKLGHFQHKETISRLRAVKMIGDKTEISQIKTYKFGAHFTCTTSKDKKYYTVDLCVIHVTHGH